MWQELKVRIGIKTSQKYLCEPLFGSLSKAGVLVASSRFAHLFYSMLWTFQCHGAQPVLFQGACQEPLKVSLQQSCWDQRTWESLFGFLHAISFSLFASQTWVERIAEPLPWVKLCSTISPTTHSITSLLIEMWKYITGHISPVPGKKIKINMRNPKLNINRMQALFMH